jgi:hypothetical protein
MISDLSLVKQTHQADEGPRRPAVASLDHLDLPGGNPGPCGKAGLSVTSALSNGFEICGRHVSAVPKDLVGLSNFSAEGPGSCLFHSAFVPQLVNGHIVSGASSSHDRYEVFDGGVAKYGHIPIASDVSFVSKAHHLAHNLAERAVHRERLIVELEQANNQRVGGVFGDEAVEVVHVECSLVDDHLLANNVRAVNPLSVGISDFSLSARAGGGG